MEYVNGVDIMEDVINGERVLIMMFSYEYLQKLTNAWDRFRAGACVVTNGECWGGLANDKIMPSPLNAAAYMTVKFDTVLGQENWDSLAPIIKQMADEYFGAQLKCVCDFSRGQWGCRCGAFQREQQLKNKEI